MAPRDPDVRNHRIECCPISYSTWVPSDLHTHGRPCTGGWGCRRLKESWEWTVASSAILPSPNRIRKMSGPSRNVPIPAVTSTTETYAPLPQQTIRIPSTQAQCAPHSGRVGTTVFLKDAVGSGRPRKHKRAFSPISCRPIQSLPSARAFHSAHTGKCSSSEFGLWPSLGWRMQSSP